MYWTISQLPEVALIPEQDRKHIVRKILWRDSWGTALRLSIAMLLMLCIFHMAQGSGWYRAPHEGSWLWIAIRTAIAVGAVKIADLFYINFFLFNRTGKMLAAYTSTAD